jgi:hypothetical protein
MKTDLHRIIVALVTFMSGIAITTLWHYYESPKFEINPALVAEPLTQSRSEVIMRVLMPNGVWGDPSQLDRFDRVEAVNTLIDAQSDAHEARALGIVFLLAALGYDYESNKEKLLRALDQCGRKMYPEDRQCYNLVADYLMVLGRRGDASLLGPLFNVSEKADGAFAQSLGGFYSDMLFERPQQFIEALEIRVKDEQRDLCFHAGGYMDRGQLRDVRQSLKRKAARSDVSRATVARICLSAAEAGHKQYIENNKSISGL